MSRLNGFRGLLLLLAMLLSGCGALVVSGTAPGGYASDEDGRPQEQQHRDAAIASRINTLFVKDPQIPAMAIRVRVRQGVVILQGRVSSDAVVRRAVRLASSVPGVVRVTSRLEVVAD